MDWPLLGRDGELDELSLHIGETSAGVILFGPTGVGKTRLARALLDRLEAPGTQVHWAVASTATTSIPYGALAGLLPDAALGAVTRTAMLGAARRHVLDLTTDRRLVVGIDDAQLLDADSLALLMHIAPAPQVSLVLTVQRGATVPDELTTLWKDGHARREDLAPLTRDAAIQLAEITLGGRLHPSLAVALWNHTRGNPLFLRELLLAPGREAWLTESAGTWRLDGTIRVPRRLADLVEGRLAGSNSEVRDGLVAVMLLDTAHVDVILELVGADALRQLEESRMVDVGLEPDSRVRLVHPLYGRVLRAITPRAHLVSVAGRLARLVESHPGTGDGRVRLARLWELASLPGRPELFLDAARQALARGDHGGALAFATESLHRGGQDDTRLTQAEALVYLGRSREGSAVLDGIDAPDDETRARIALLRCHDQLFNADDVDGAIAAIEQVRATVTTEPWKDRLDAATAMAALRRGDAQRSIALPVASGGLESTDDRALLSNLIMRSLAQVLMGDLADAEPAVARAEPLARRLRVEMPLACDQLAIHRAMLAWHGACVDEAASLATAALADASDEGAIDRLGIWATMHGLFLAEAGQLQAALHRLEDAATHLATSDPLGLRTTAITLSARCHAGLGDTEAAADQLAEVADAVATDIRTRIHHGRATAWVLAADGAITSAIETALESGAEAVASAHVVWGAVSIHDTVRFGAGARALEFLAPLAERHDAGLLTLYRKHARAVTDEDPEALGAVADRFTQSGLQLYAAEAHAQAADLLRRRDRPREARRADARASALLQHLPAVRTPALMQTEDPLTRREREIAMIARTGRSSRDIAARLSLSVRTVDNHLAAVYRKTGIEGRHQLDDLLPRVRSTDPV
jgi:DNA-binding CsgD family transcriptional regulator